mmetsp:Transcript_14848/g.25172  ORF Transcript_14848/g.25172 Transcript_14848/m.25172 type:complete len:210 (+) Transcript_14848:160-789(+)
MPLRILKHFHNENEYSEAVLMLNPVYRLSLLMAWVIRVSTMDSAILSSDPPTSWEESIPSVYPLAKTKQRTPTMDISSTWMHRSKSLPPISGRIQNSQTAFTPLVSPRGTMSSEDTLPNTIIHQSIHSFLSMASTPERAPFPIADHRTRSQQLQPLPRTMLPFQACVTCSWSKLVEPPIRRMHRAIPSKPIIGEIHENRNFPPIKSMPS